MTTDNDITFGLDGSSVLYQLGGWSGPEPGMTWAVGSESQLLVPPPTTLGDCLLEIHVHPFVHWPVLPAQRLTVCVEGVTIGSSRIGRRVRLAYRVPADLVRPGENIHIRFLHPDAARPCDICSANDDRFLAFAFRLLRLTPMPDRLNRRDARASMPSNVQPSTGLRNAELMLKFESIGQGCEFGLVQRRCGAEPLGLFRFGSVFVDNLLRGLDCGFDGIDDRDAIDVRLEPHPTHPEFMVTQTGYDVVYHTYVYAGQASAEQIKDREAKKLKLLKRKLLDDLEQGDKIFVRTMLPEVSSEHEMIPLFLALNRYGANTLLWVAPADDTHPPGTVECVATGLLRGFIDRFPPIGGDSHDFSFDVWMSICANAFALSRHAGFVAGDGVAA